MKQAFAIIADFVNIKIANNKKASAWFAQSNWSFFDYVNNLEHG